MAPGRAAEKVAAVEENDEEQEDEDEEGGEGEIDMEKALAKGDELFIKEEYGRVISFGISWGSVEGEVVDLDLAGVALRPDGSIEDCAFYASLKGSSAWMRHMGDTCTPGKSKAVDHERICVHMDGIPESVHAVVFIISNYEGPQQPSSRQPSEGGTGGGGEREKRQGWALPSWVLFRVHSEEMEEVVKTTVHEEMGAAGNGSMVVCSLHRIAPIRGRPPAWGITGLRTPARSRSWGATLQELHSHFQTLVPAPGPAAGIQGEFVVRPKLGGLTLNEQVAFAHAGFLEDPPPPKQVEAQAHQDAEAEAEAESAEEGSSSSSSKEQAGPSLRVDVGWVTEEGVKNDAEMFCLLFDGNGELLDQVSRKAKEVDGVWLATDVKAIGEEQSEWPGLYPIKEQLVINLDELVEGTMSIVILLTNFGGPGLSIVESCHCRLIDTSSEDDPKDLVVLNLDIPSAQHDDDNEEEEEDDVLTAIVVCRLCRQVPNKAAIEWRRCGSPDPAEFLKSVRERKQDLRKTEAEVVPDEPWRIQAEGLLSRGASLADCMDCLTDCVTYHGGRDKKQRREDDAASASYASGDLFWGKYVAGLRQGMGIYFFSNGAMFLGSYKNGLRSGQGWFVLPDGSWYEGGFRKDLMHGHGNYVYSQGGKYVGEYKKGRKSGHGTYYYTDGGQIAGEWKDGAHDGSVVWLQGSYGQFEGGFKSGIPDGQATFSFPKTGLTQLGCYRTANDLEEPPKHPLWQGLEWLPDKYGLFQKLSADTPPHSATASMAHRAPPATMKGSQHLNKVKCRQTCVRARGKNFHL